MKGVGQWNSRALEFSHCWGLHLGNVGLGQRMQDKITEPSHEEIYPKIQFKPPWPFLVTWGRDWATPHCSLVENDPNPAEFSHRTQLGQVLGIYWLYFTFRVLKIAGAAELCDEFTPFVLDEAAGGSEQQNPASSWWHCQVWWHLLPFELALALKGSKTQLMQAELCLQRFVCCSVHSAAHFANFHITIQPRSCAPVWCLSGGLMGCERKALKLSWLEHIRKMGIFSNLSILWTFLYIFSYFAAAGCLRVEVPAGWNRWEHKK